MRISYWSSDVCSSDLRHLPPLRRKRVLRGNQLVDRLAHVPPTLQVPGELFDELLEPRPALRPRSFRVRLRDWRYHDQVVAHEQIGRAHVCTPVTNAHLVCRLLLEKKKKHNKLT